MSESPEFREGRALVKSLQSVEEQPKPVSFWNEFRAVYSRPASFLDSQEDRDEGYVTCRTDWFKSPVAARQAATKNSEETHAVYQGMEMSWVTRSEAEKVSS